MDFAVNAGDVNVTIYVKLRSATSGLALPGLAFNSSGVACYYTRPLAAAVQIPLVTQTVTGAHTDGGFVEVDATNAKGLYRLDLPDAACAAGANFVIVSIEFDNAVEESVEILLDHNLKVRKYLQLLSRRDVSLNTTELAELNLGSGSFDNTTDSLQAIEELAAVAPLNWGDTVIDGDGITSVNIVYLDDDATALANLKQSSLAVRTGTVQAAEGSANTNTVFDTDLPLENALYYGNSSGGIVIAFVSGTTNQFQTRRLVSSITGTANTRITLEEALDAIPSNGDAFVVLGRITELS